MKEELEKLQADKDCLNQQLADARQSMLNAPQINRPDSIPVLFYSKKY